MGITDKLRSSLPNPETVTTHTQVAALVKTIEGKYEAKLKRAMELHPELYNAWEVLSVSAHPDHAPISDELPDDDARRIMVRDVIAVLNGGELPPAKVEAA